MKSVLLLFSLFLFSLMANAQKTALLKKQCDDEQLRLDKLDLTADSRIKLNNEPLTQRATTIYITKIDDIQKQLESASFPSSETENFYTTLNSVLKGLNSSNIRYLGYFEQYFDMLLYLSKNKGTTADIEYLKNHVGLALECIPFYVKRSYAKEFMIYAAAKKPYDAISKYEDYSHEKWFIQVLESAAHNDPNAVKQFFGSMHTIDFTLRTSKDPVVLKMYEIYGQYGAGSEAYTNIDKLMKNQMTIKESHELSLDYDKWFKELIVARRDKNILGTYSVDKQLEAYSNQQIRKVNDLHEETNEKIRFAAVEVFNSEELYQLIVYSQDEIYTSSFLGCFKRLMQKRTDSSVYVLLQKTGFNRFRTFIQMCAGYNTLQQVLNTMSPSEKNKLFDDIVKDLENTGGNLSPAVEVAEIYSSINDSLLKKEFGLRLKSQLERCVIQRNNYGIKLYGLLYKLTGNNPAAITGNIYNFDIPDMTTVEASLNFPDGKNIQQHIFYDDEDGLAAYNSFLGNFKSDKNWLLTEDPQYTKVESKTGKKIIIYCNKPNVEGSIEFVNNLFQTQRRYPDLVVHRGHSYHLKYTIELLTNNVKIAILGSCGGFNNITRVLDNASDAQIVSSKQIGTWTVNNVLIKDLCEQMRTGTGAVNWPLLWEALEKKLKTNPKWKDYVPPHNNLGVKFVKAFVKLDADN